MSYGNNPIDNYKKQQQQSDKFEKIPLEVENEEQGLRKAAKFIMLLGKEEGAKVLSHLKEEEIEKICREIAGIQAIDKEESLEVLQEFGFRSLDKQSILHGGIETAQALLEDAFGKDKAREYLKKTIPEAVPGHFDFLENVELPQLLHLLKEESNLVLSLVLSQLPSEKVAAVIKTMAPENSVEVIKRMARMQQVDSIVLEKTAESLKEKLKSQSSWKTEEVNGSSRLAEILKHMDSRSEEMILNDLKQFDTNIEHQIKDQLFTLDSLYQLREKDFQAALKDYTEKELAILLRKKPDHLQDLFKKNLSSRRWLLIQEEDNLMGPILRIDSQKTTREFLTSIREKIDNGKYILLKEGEYI